MSSKDFLDRMREAGQKHSEELAFLTVAKMRIQFGYSGFVAGERPANFFKPFGDPKDTERVAAEVSARLAKVGSKRKAVMAILLDIPEETNTGEKVTWDIKQISFTSNDEDSEWQILFNALCEGEFPINEWFWGSYKNEVVGEYEKDGEKKKRYLSIPVEKYDSEAAAKDAAGDSGGASTNSQWSDTLKDNYPDPDVFEKNVNDIHAAMNKVKAGELPWEGAPDLPVPPTPPKQKQYLASLFDCASSDIDIALNMTPF